MSLHLGRKRALAVGCALSTFAFVATSGCGRDIEVGFDVAAGVGGLVMPGGAGGSAGGGAGAGQSGGDGGEVPCQPTECRGQLYACGNCDDDDDDGRSDAFDEDCLGPCDDDESGLSTGLITPGASPCRQDCYFDGDSGAGNDKCEWSQACDPLSLAPDYPPSGDARCAYVAGATPMGVDCASLALSQPSSCLDACLPLVPNGCDCFGCCELPGRSGDYYFVGGGRGGACQLDALGDPTRCPPCTPVQSCLNACEDCEGCVGAGLAPSCGGKASCPTGSRACDMTAPCDFGDYCVTGCCIRAPEPI